MKPLEIGEMVKIHDPRERRGALPGPAHYGRVLNFTQNPDGTWSPIVSCLMWCDDFRARTSASDLVSIWVPHVKRERVERVFHPFSDN